MKKDIHPKLYTDCVVTCACGNTFKTVSTLPTIHVEVCGACHPFYTGERRFVDTEKRIDKFTRKYAMAETKKQETIAAKKAKAEKKVAAKEVVHKSVKELLDDMKTK